MIVALVALFVAVGGTAYATKNQQQVLGADIVSRVTVSPYVNRNEPLPTCGKELT